MPGPIESFWTPSEAVVVDAEASLLPVLQHALDSRRAGGRPAALFYRQYAGFAIAGTRVVYINGFAKQSPRPLDWRTRPQMVCDGGAGFFGAVYDPETKTIWSVVFNS